MPGEAQAGTLSADPADVPAAVRSYFDALNAESWDALAGVWAESADLRAVGARPRRGREDIMSYCRALFGPWAEHLDRPTRYIVAGTTIVVEVEFTGVTHEGREIAFDALDVFEVSGDAIDRLTIWYDLVWVRKQL